MGSLSGDSPSSFSSPPAVRRRSSRTLRLSPVGAVKSIVSSSQRGNLFDQTHHSLEKTEENKITNSDEGSDLPAGFTHLSPPTLPLSSSVPAQPRASSRDDILMNSTNAGTATPKMTASNLLYLPGARHFYHIRDSNTSYPSPFLRTGTSCRYKSFDFLESGAVDPFRTAILNQSEHVLRL